MGRAPSRLKTINQINMTIFSRIIAGEIPCFKIAEDDNFFAFLDIRPMTKGHTLVVPKLEVDYIFDLEDTTIANMMVFAKKVAKAIEKSVTCTRVGVTVIGLEVPHAHIHLIPIQRESDMNFHNAKLQLSNEEMLEIAQKISQNF
jgi:histidine triad (HIT) family protein